MTIRVFWIGLSRFIPKDKILLSWWSCRKLRSAILGLTSNELWVDHWQKKIVSVYKGYYVIVSHQYSFKGILPPHLFIDGLMKFLQRKYYVSLLSAAAIHGAAHQQPQEYYVMIEHPALRPMSKRGLKINHVNKNNINKDFVEQRKKEYRDNLNAKIEDSEFLGDTIGLLRPDEKYDHRIAYDSVSKELIGRM